VEESIYSVSLNFHRNRNYCIQIFRGTLQCFSTKGSYGAWSFSDFDGNFHELKARVGAFINWRLRSICINRVKGVSDCNMNGKVSFIHVQSNIKSTIQSNMASLWMVHTPDFGSSPLKAILIFCTINIYLFIKFSDSAKNGQDGQRSYLADLYENEASGEETGIREPEIQKYNSSIHIETGMSGPPKKVFTYFWRIRQVHYKLTGNQTKTTPLQHTFRTIILWHNRGSHGSGNWREFPWSSNIFQTT